MDMLISLIVVIISQCMHVAEQHFVHHKYIQFLFVNYTSIKLDTFLINFFNSMEEMEDTVKEFYQKIQ